VEQEGLRFQLAACWSAIPSGATGAIVSKIKTLIVDDEPLGREAVRNFLSRDPEIELAGESTDGAQAVAAIQQQRPDLVFLDVQMPEMDGLDVIANVGPE